MAAPSKFWVDADNGDNGNTGLSYAQAWADTQHFLDNATKDTTHGTKLLHAGSETVTSALDFSTFGAMSRSAPLTIEAVTDTEGDGGASSISGGGTTGIFDDTTLDYLCIKGMELHNTGSNKIINLDNFIRLVGCYLHDGAGVALDTEGYIYGCRFANMTGDMLEMFWGQVFGNLFENGTNKCNVAVTRNQSSENMLMISGNLFNLDSTSNAIEMDDSVVVVGNDIFSAGGTGSGILQRGSTSEVVAILNNYIEGFSGSGGVGLDLSSGADVWFYGGNRFYNNATNKNIVGDIHCTVAADEILSGSAFVNPPTDFTKQDQGGVKGGAWPTAWGTIAREWDTGAIQIPATGGGTTGVYPATRRIQVPMRGRRIV